MSRHYGMNTITYFATPAVPSWGKATGT